MKYEDMYKVPVSHKLVQFLNNFFLEQSRKFLGNSNYWEITETNRQQIFLEEMITKHSFSLSTDSDFLLFADHIHAKKALEELYNESHDEGKLASLAPYHQELAQAYFQVASAEAIEKHPEIAELIDVPINIIQDHGKKPNSFDHTPQSYAEML